MGGAFAMAAHGYTRATRDIDLFIGDDGFDYEAASLTELFFGAERPAQGTPVDISDAYFKPIGGWAQGWQRRGVGLLPRGPPTSRA